MTLELYLAFLGFAFVSTATPGPNNLMVMASGANFGIRRSLPHLLGIGVGFAVMLFCVGLGLAQVFTLFPVLRTILAVISVAYLLWLAWKIANAAAPEGAEARGKPFTFLQAAAFQWVNPKAWTMALTAITLYASGSIWAVLIAALTFWAVSLPAVGAWAFIGQQVTRWLTSPARLRAFNWTMAALLVASLWPTIAPLLS